MSRNVGAGDAGMIWVRPRDLLDWRRARHDSDDRGHPRRGIVKLRNIIGLARPSSLICLNSHLLTRDYHFAQSWIGACQ